MDRTHNPEFTVMEIYVAYKDYIWMMGFVEEMLERVAKALHGKTEVMIDGREISFARPFRRVTMTDAIREKTGFDITGKSEGELREACKKLNVETDETMGKGKLIDAIFGQYCEEDLIQPTFVTDYPIDMSPLCKRHRNNPDLTERFELFVNGKELCNAYSELNDPIDQLERFQEQLRLSEKRRRRGDVYRYGFRPSARIRYADLLGNGNRNRPTDDVHDRTDDDSGRAVLPANAARKSGAERSGREYAAAGVPAEWVPVLQKMGFLTVDALKKTVGRQAVQRPVRL